ncbi:MAG: hypothetical protein J6Y99_12455 [Bacteroidales bacterium]|nr:hypothetical protein [Bacteroidales bacterium]
MSDTTKTLMRIAFVICVIGYLFFRQFERIKIVTDNRKELSEQSTRRKSVKACVIDYYRNYNGSFKTKTFVYRFVVDNLTYEGISQYNKGKQQTPEVGDSIWVYYKEDDPNVNLWVEMFEY